MTRALAALPYANAFHSPTILPVSAPAPEPSPSDFVLRFSILTGSEPPDESWVDPANMRTSLPGMRRARRGPKKSNLPPGSATTSDTRRRYVDFGDGNQTEDPIPDLAEDFRVAYETVPPSPEPL